jgi:hypothetical protein
MRQRTRTCARERERGGEQDAEHDTRRSGVDFRSSKFSCDAEHDTRRGGVDFRSSNFSCDAEHDPEEKRCGLSLQQILVRCGVRYEEKRCRHSLQQLLMDAERRRRGGEAAAAFRSSNFSRTLDAEQRGEAAAAFRSGNFSRSLARSLAQETHVGGVAGRLDVLVVVPAAEVLERHVEAVLGQEGGELLLVGGAAEGEELREGGSAAKGVRS